MHDVAAQAANVFTSGLFFGGLFAMLLAILLVTNEYYHQTATTTFLTTPHRSAVIVAKFVVAMIAAALFWLITTVLDVIAGIIYFKAEGFGIFSDNWDPAKGQFGAGAMIYGTFLVGIIALVLSVPVSALSGDRGTVQIFSGMTGHFWPLTVAAE